EGTSTNITDGTNVSRSIGESVGHAVSNTLGHAVTSGLSKAVGAFASTSLGANFGVSFARSSSVTANVGKSEGITQTFTNYTIKHALEVLERQMARLDQASALGMWDFAAYVLSEDHGVVANVAHSYLALTQGEDSFVSQASVNRWRGDIRETAQLSSCILEYLCDLRHPLFALKPALIEADPKYAVYPSVVNATTALSGKELAYSLNFPNKSVAGLPVIECAEFGRNVVRYDAPTEGSSISLGMVFHMHRKESVNVELDLQSLTSHAFVTGSTGAGKTNTVCKILDEVREKGICFLVIEPAKGEYKDLYGSEQGVSVFGTNAAFSPLLKINPFSFPSNVHVLEHLDRLIEVFNVCWPMYAAMPAVLKNAVEKSYSDCGWNLSDSTNEYGNLLFPTFADVARNVKSILDESEYDAENKGAYKGSLLTRLQSLTNGINGAIFGSDEIAPETLFDSNVIVDLSRIGSTETKSLLMGMLVLKLQEHRMATSNGLNLPLRHVTVLEEAHNLLKRTSTEQVPEGGNLIGKSVEMLSNAIAEMRTYGEGFVIADQSPGLLDLSVIRNTNTKVIMRLPDLSDRELVGRAATLNDSQIVELSRLPRGVAAVYQNNWIQPVLCLVEKAHGGQRFSYTDSETKISLRSPEDALLVIDALTSNTGIVGDSTLVEIKAAMERLSLSSYTRVQILKMLGHHYSEPAMTKLGPIASELFPEVRDSVVDSYDAYPREPYEWTEAAERALEDMVKHALPDYIKRDIIQAIIADYVFKERRNEDAYRDWQKRGELS
ncbi:MAG: DUF87 domain-containing protein, partial [Coriobacteriales bacterium]|nr:DUF87 domain-containing protein [Coriobacteriales bacterium]